jgi:hypothetical protein
MTRTRLALRLLAALLSAAVVCGIYLIVLTRGSLLP